MPAAADEARIIEDMRMTSFRLHALQGGRKGLLVPNGAGELENAMRMKKPPHPGLSVRLNCLEPLNLSVMEGASRSTLSRLIEGQADA